MTTNTKRFTISVTLQMSADLNATKQKYYYQNSQNDMIQDLIIRGLSTLNTKGTVKIMWYKKHSKTSQ